MKIYEPAGRAREYSPLALNYFKGCTHGCLYCYVPNMMGRFRSGYDHAACSGPTEAGFAELELSAKKMEGCEKQILLSFTGDPYCGVAPESTTRVLQILKKYGHKVAILTKNPENALNDIDLIRSFGDRIKIGTTLTFDNAADSLHWESGAALPDSRIAALDVFHQLGVKTWASFEPVIIPEQSISLLSAVVEHVDHVKIGKVNNYRGLDKGIDWAKFIDTAVGICQASDTEFYIKNDLAEFNNNTFLHPRQRDADYLNL